MKKIIQIFSFLFLAIFVSVISVNAQTKLYKAQIPFDFKVGEKSYHSGSYILEVKKTSNGNPILLLKNEEGKYLQMVSGIQSGQPSEGQAKLTFSKSDNQRYLTNLVTPETNLPIPIQKAGKLIAGTEQIKHSKPETVSIALN